MCECVPDSVQEDLVQMRALARQVAAALGRPCAVVACGGPTGAAGLCGARSGPPGRIVEELRRVGVRNPVFLLDEVDRLDEGSGAAALLEVLDPAPGATFRDRYLDLPFDLSEAIWVATPASFGTVPAVLRERMRVIELPGYTEAENCVIATGHLLPLQRMLHELTADQVRVTGEAVEVLVRGYTREAGVWRLFGALGEVCAKVVRRRAEGDEAPVEVTPQTIAGMLGAPAPADAQVAGRTGRPGVAVGLCRTAAGGGEVMVVEASRMAGSGKLTLTGRQGEVMQESARTALSWLRTNARRYGLDPAALHRDADVHVHVQSGEVSKEGVSAGVTLAVALVSRGHRAHGPRRPRDDRRDLPLGAGSSRSAASRRRCSPRTAAGWRASSCRSRTASRSTRTSATTCGPAVRIHYVTRIEELLELALRPGPAAGEPAAVTPTAADRAGVLRIGGRASGNAAQGPTSAAGCSPSTERRILLAGRRSREAAGARTRAAANRRPPLPHTVHRPMGHGGGGRGRTSSAPDT